MILSTKELEAKMGLITYHRDESSDAAMQAIRESHEELLEKLWEEHNLCGICPYRQAIQKKNEELEQANSDMFVDAEMKRVAWEREKEELQEVLRHYRRFRETTVLYGGKAAIKEEEDLDNHAACPHKYPETCCCHEARIARGEEKGCVCGAPNVPGVVHRTDGPCYEKERFEDLLAKGEITGALLLRGNFTEDELAMIQQAYQAGIDQQQTRIEELQGRIERVRVAAGYELIDESSNLARIRDIVRED